MAVSVDRAREKRLVSIIQDQIYSCLEINQRSTVLTFAIGLVLGIGIGAICILFGK